MYRVHCNCIFGSTSSNWFLVTTNLFYQNSLHQLDGNGWVFSQGLPNINLPSIANRVCSSHCQDIHPCCIESSLKFHQSSNEIPLLFNSSDKGRKMIYFSSTILFLDERFEEIVLSPIVG
jgi:hypothetical protein